MDTIKRVAFESILKKQKTLEDILNTSREHRRYTEIYKDLICKRVLEISGYIILRHNPCGIYAELVKLSGNAKNIKMTDELLKKCITKEISNDMREFLRYNGYGIDNIKFNSVYDTVDSVDSMNSSTSSVESDLGRRFRFFY